MLVIHAGSDIRLISFCLKMVRRKDGHVRLGQ
jgi:hypothetical protein